MLGKEIYLIYSAFPSQGLPGKYPVMSTFHINGGPRCITKVGAYYSISNRKLNMQRLWNSHYNTARLLTRGITSPRRIKKITITKSRIEHVHEHQWKNCHEKHQRQRHYLVLKLAYIMIVYAVSLLRRGDSFTRKLLQCMKVKFLIASPVKQLLLCYNLWQSCMRKINKFWSCS